jgi:hypothetical protein
MVGFVVEYMFSGPPGEAHAKLLRIAPTLGRRGFYPAQDSRQQIRFEYRHRPTWVYIACVLLFPVGLLLLLLEKELHVVNVSIDGMGETSEVTISGQADRDVAQFLHGFEEDDGFFLVR